MDDVKMPTCGDCIHADVCARIPYYTEFSRDNPAYCKNFAAENNVGRWIPVTERLPDKDGDYLIFKKSPYGGWREVAGFAKDGGKVDEYDLGGCENVWYDYDSEYGYISFESVTHWMPLPEPPKVNADDT